MTTRNRIRGVAITLNNYNEEEYNNIKILAQGTCEKWILGKEVGEKGTPHIQGYLYFRNARDYHKIVKDLNNARIHVDKARGNHKQNYKYCSKDELHEFGGFTDAEMAIEVVVPPMPRGELGDEFVLMNNVWHQVVDDLESLRDTISRERWTPEAIAQDLIDFPEEDDVGE